MSLLIQNLRPLEQEVGGASFLPWRKQFHLVHRHPSCLRKPHEGPRPLEPCYLHHTVFIGKSQRGWSEKLHWGKPLADLFSFMHLVNELPNYFDHSCNHSFFFSRELSSTFYLSKNLEFGAWVKNEQVSYSLKAAIDNNLGMFISPMSTLHSPKTPSLLSWTAPCVFPGCCTLSGDSLAS